MDQRDKETVAWGRLTIAADQLDDMERVRIATSNRLRSLTEPVEIKSAGIVIDKGMANTPESQALEAQLDALKAAEKSAVRELQRAMKAHPLAGFVSGNKGIGEKTVGRLLGSIGHPLFRYDPETEEEVERTVSQLRSYCGCGDMAEQRRKKGVKSNWNAEARKQMFVIAEGTIKSRCYACREAGKEREEGEGWTPPPKGCTCEADGFHYRATFDKARGSYEGTDITDGHKMNRALQKVKKEFLKDLWLEARRVQSPGETHETASPSRQPEAAA